MMKPQFSIVTICFNEEENISSTCESIIQQSVDNYEWIVIDGGSTDETLSILDRYKDSITYMKSEPDNGIYDAMNKGICKATGEHLIFMNGGDRFASSEVLLWVSAAPQYDLIYGDILLQDECGKLLTFPDQISRGYLLKKMVPHQATFYRRALFDRFGSYDISYKIAGDYELYVRLLERSQVSHHHVNKPLAVFMLGGVSNDKKFRKLRKSENHRIRMEYSSRYRWSPKAWRQIVCNLMASIKHRIAHGGFGH